MSLEEVTSAVSEKEPEVGAVVSALVNIEAGEIIRAILTVIIGLVVIRAVLKLIDRLLKQLPQQNRAAFSFLKAIMKAFLYFILATIAVTSLVAILSLFALAVSLSVQNLLSNLISGFIILICKPFNTGDWIETPNASGSVYEINLVYTHLLSADNKQIMIPNSEVASSRIINYSVQKTRRIDVKVLIPYEEDPAKVKEALLAAATLTNVGHDGGTPPFSGVQEYADHGIYYIARMYVPNADYWDCYYLLMDNIWQELEKRNIHMTYAGSRVRVTGEDK